MNTLEDRLIAALRETGEEITRGSVPPLVLDPRGVVRVSPVMPAGAAGRPG